MLPMAAYTLFRSAYDAALVATGPVLLAATAHDAATRTSRHLWSSDPAVYPVGGVGPKRDTHWGARVLLDGRVFVGQGEDAIRANLADAPTILALGFRSVVNVPIAGDGALIGILTFFWPAARVLPDRLALAERLARGTAPGFRAAVEAPLRPRR